MPAAGQRYQVLEYASKTGTFSSIQVTGLPANLVVMPEYNATNMTLVVSAALHAEGSPASGPPPEKNIPAAALNAILNAAIARWAATGLSDSALVTLRAAEIRVEDLPPHVLAAAAGNVIHLDDDAASFGWFLDPTPNDDLQFAESPTAADDRMDLLTAVMHEMGHLLGLDDELESPSKSLMAYRLSAGKRHWLK